MYTDCLNNLALNSVRKNVEIPYRQNVKKLKNVHGFSDVQVINSIDLQLLHTNSMKS